jgi:hypothetical protein
MFHKMPVKEIEFLPGSRCIDDDPFFIVGNRTSYMEPEGCGIHKGSEPNSLYLTGDRYLICYKWYFLLGHYNEKTKLINEQKNKA